MRITVRLIKSKVRKPVDDSLSLAAVELVVAGVVAGSIYLLNTQLSGQRGW